MKALREIAEARQAPGEPARRWFTCERMELTVWVGPDATIRGFQLCYDKTGRERAVTWRRGAGLSHMAVDPGDVPLPGHKGSPILIADGILDAAALRREFLELSANVPEHIVELVASHLTDPERESS